MKYDKEIVVKWFAEHGLNAVPEYHFTPTRKWRFDFVISDGKAFELKDWFDRVIALEVEGGAWTNGRHTRGSGFVKDLEKYNEAAALGWRILRVTPDQLCMQETVDLIKRALNYG